VTKSTGVGQGRPRLKLSSPLSKQARVRARKLRHRKTPVEQLALRPMEPPDSLRATMAGYLEAMVVLNMAESTLQSRGRDFRLFAEWCEARALHKPTDVTRPILERYQRYLYYYRKGNGSPLATERQYVMLTQLKSLFRWATRQNILLANPAADLLMPKLPVRLPRYTLTPKQVEKMLACCDATTLIGLRDRAMVEVLWATGIRRSELSHLSMWDVQWERGTVFVREGKGLKDRVVPISQRALRWARRYVEEVRPRYALSPDDGHLFLSETGRSLTAEALTAMVGGLVRRSGVEAKGACHLLRHSCATAMLEAGADVRYVQELLGHVDLNTTQIYTRVSIAKLKEVYEATHPGARAGEKMGSGEENPVDAGELLAELEDEVDAEVGTVGVGE
jgi:integrase/recombinase XerD